MQTTPRKYRQKVPVVEAYQVQVTTSVSDEYGTLSLNPGDWLIKYNDGTFDKLNDKTFRERYEQAEGE